MHCWVANQKSRAEEVRRLCRQRGAGKAHVFVDFKAAKYLQATHKDPSHFRNYVTVEFSDQTDTRV